MRFGNVYICRFPFTSGAAGKVRPSLVLFDLGADAIICRITSASRADPLDVSLADWSAAGLLKPSVARLDSLVTAEKSILRPRSACSPCRTGTRSVPSGTPA